MRVISFALIFFCGLGLPVVAKAGEPMTVSNAELWERYLTSDTQELVEAEIKNWVAGYVDAFGSIYAFEMANGDHKIAGLTSCAHKYDIEDIYLLLITSGAIEKLRDLPVIQTIYLMLRLECKGDATIGSMPEWIAAGGYDKLGIQIEEESEK